MASCAKHLPGLYPTALTLFLVLALLSFGSARPDGPLANSTTPAVPPVFTNGAWDPDHPGTRNAYVAALLSKDVYYKHLIDPRDGRAARRNFTLFATKLCRSMRRLGAEDCEPVAGALSLVWAVVRAGRSVVLVFRGSNTPQDWVTDVASLRTTTVGDFGGGPRGTNVAAGFYKVFAANRRAILSHVQDFMARAAAAATAAAAAAAEAEAPAVGAVHAAAVTTRPATTLITGTATTTHPDGAVAGGGDDSGGGGGGGGDDSGGGGGGGGGGARLWVFGHSLGGAVALMTAAYLDVRQGLTATGVYTFGCPRVGDATFARAYRLHDVTLRLENTGDLIPTLPFGRLWRHVGDSCTIQYCGDAAIAEAASAEAHDVAAAAAAGAYDASASAAVATRGQALGQGQLQEAEMEGSLLEALQLELNLRVGDQPGRERQPLSELKPPQIWFREEMETEEGQSDGEHDSGLSGLLRGWDSGAAATPDAIQRRQRRRLQQQHQQQWRRLRSTSSANPAIAAIGKPAATAISAAAAAAAAAEGSDGGAAVPAGFILGDGDNGGDSSVTTDSSVQAANDDVAGTGVAFPFPVLFRSHWIETYLRVLWSCLPLRDQDLVPGPEDVYLMGAAAAAE